MAQTIHYSVNDSTIYNPNAYPTPSGFPAFGHRRFSSQKHKSKRAIFATNTLPYRFNKDVKSNNNSVRQQADIIRYIAGKDSVETISFPQRDLEHLYFQNVFTPDVHSTPIHRHKEYSSKRHKKKSVECNGNFYPHDFELHKCSENGIPTVSKYVDSSQLTRDSRSSITFPPSENTVIKRRGLRGVSWILRLALKDTTIGKIYRRQIGWIVLVLVVLILAGGLLVHYSSHFTSYHHVIPYTNFTSLTKLRTGEIDRNSSSSLDSLLVKNRHLSNVSLATISYIITSPVESQTTSSEEQVDYKTENVRQEPIARNLSNHNEDYKNLLIEYCKGCRKGLDVCIAVAENGIPMCKAASDMADPTGCGGLCALEIEACHLLDHNHSIYTCKRLETLEMCKPYEWRCDNFLCVHKDKRCDGQMDCYDQSDEYHCPCNLSESFHCANETSCMPNSKRCDTIVDCWDGSDEHNCTIICPDNQFTCNNGDCVNSSLFCDGYPDCLDGSDEPYGCGGDCMSSEFKCANKRCILKRRVCNGVDNCGDMSDELNCPTVKTS